MSLPLPILAFFVLHWQVSVFFQSFFLHRYASHRMFSMSPRWERFFHFCTYLAQGSSYLKPHAYAILHRTHHAYADAPGDPHSPKVHGSLLRMMLLTKRHFEDISQRGLIREPRFAGNVPEWPALERWGSSRASGLLWAGAYTAVYACFATAWWHYALLPFHFLMGPLHGSIVNWCGHWAGYRNFETDDCSRNTLVVDVLTCGELYQNNHHRFPSDPNFAKRWFELDLTYPAIRLFDHLGIIQLKDRHERRAERRHQRSERTRELRVSRQRHAGPDIHQESALERAPSTTPSPLPASTP